MSRTQETTGKQHSSDLETAELTAASAPPAAQTQTRKRWWEPLRTEFSRTLPQGLTQHFPQRKLSRETWAYVAGAIAMAALAALDPTVLRMSERNIESLFFEIRGPLAAPSNIAIVTIDDSSLDQGNIYQQDPEGFPDLEPIQTWPWKREAYGIVLDRLLSAGAKAVVLDITLPTPSSYGPADDEKFAAMLRRYPGQVVIAERFVSSEDLLQGLIYQREQPLEQFREAGASTGFINLLTEPDGRVHRLGHAFIEQLKAQDPLLDVLFEDDPAYSLAEATLGAAGADVDRMMAQARGDNIFFYGPRQTFAHIPFWLLLDSGNWKEGQFAGQPLADYFQDKIVLIGATSQIHQDFHPAPFGETGIYGQLLSGVEIQANAIATLQEGVAIAHPFRNQPVGRALLLLSLLGAGGLLLLRTPSPLSRWILGVGTAAIWAVGSFAIFTFGQTLIPVTLPVLGLTILGGSQFVLGFVQEQKRKQKLRQALRDRASVPAVREILSQQDDMQDLLLEREAEMIGKLLSSRYQVMKVLGTGGFSETYVAKDTQRPGSPPCVVKQLRLVQGKPSKLELVRRLFKLEAETLERLGQHGQIPQLLAYFEEDYEFYLVQELIEGQSLHGELLRKARLPLYAIIQLLYDMLNVLEFVHDSRIIHRDIKPHNIIRRIHDGKFVLIDFGVAKKISDQVHDDQTQALTIAIGTQGYIAREQIAGKPKYASDLYSLGVTAIEALTGLIPRQFQHDPQGEILWAHRAEFVSGALQRFLCRMVRMDVAERFSSAREALRALQDVPEIGLLKEERPQIASEVDIEQAFMASEDETEDALADTQIWQQERNSQS